MIGRLKEELQDDVNHLDQEETQKERRERDWERERAQERG